MANNKVELTDGTVLLDLTGDTITSDKLVKGYTAHDASGAAITGNGVCFPLEPITYDYEKGYTNSGVFKYEDSTNNHSDFYEVIEDHRYLLSLGGTVGTRFRSAVITTNPIGTLVDIPGTQVINQNSPKPYAYAIFTAATDGYCVVTKDNASTKGLKSYLFDITAE